MLHISPRNLLQKYRIFFMNCLLFVAVRSPLPHSYRNPSVSDITTVKIRNTSNQHSRMAQPHELLLVVFVSVVLFESRVHGSSSDISLSVDRGIVKLNATVTFTCIIRNKRELSSQTWRLLTKRYPTGLTMTTDASVLQAQYEDKYTVSGLDGGTDGGDNYFTCHSRECRYTLVVTRADLGDDGDYQCCYQIVRDPFSKTAKLIVLVAPDGTYFVIHAGPGLVPSIAVDDLTSQDIDGELAYKVNVDDKVTFSCPVQGTHPGSPEPRLTLLFKAKNDEEYKEVNAKHAVSNFKDKKVIFTVGSLDFSGYYRCKAKNRISVSESPESSAIRLEVTAGPPESEILSQYKLTFLILLVFTFLVAAFGSAFYKKKMVVHEKKITTGLDTESVATRSTARL